MKVTLWEKYEEQQIIFTALSLETVMACFHTVDAAYLFSSKNQRLLYESQI